MSEAKLVDFFDREYSEPPTGLDRAHMASLETSERYGVTVRTESRADRPGDLLIYADDMLWGVVQIVEKEAWKKSGVLDVYEYDCYGIDWTQYPHFPGKQACSHRGRYHIPGGFENLDVADARGAVTAQFIFRNLHELQGGPLAPKYAEVEGSEGAPRRRYRLLHSLKQKHNTVKAGAVSGLIDGPGVLPHWGTAWITNTCLVKSVRLWENTLVRANSTIVGFPDGGKMSTIDAEYISQSHLYLLKDSFINGRHLDNVKLSGGVVMCRGSVLTDSTIGPSLPEGYVRIPEGTSLKSANLTANVNGKLPFVTVGPIGSESGQLTVWKDDVLTGIRVRRGCFTGTVEEFLEANERTHKDVNLEVYEIYRDLLPILQRQVLKVANGTPEYDEDEE